MVEFLTNGYKPRNWEVGGGVHSVQVPEVLPDNDGPITGSPPRTGVYGMLGATYELIQIDPGLQAVVADIVGGAGIGGNHVPAFLGARARYEQGFNALDQSWSASGSLGYTWMAIRPIDTAYFDQIDRTNNLANVGHFLTLGGELAFLQKDQAFALTPAVHLPVGGESDLAFAITFSWRPAWDEGQRFTPKPREDTGRARLARRNFNVRVQNLIATITDTFVRKSTGVVVRDVAGRRADAETAANIENFKACSNAMVQTWEEVIENTSKREIKKVLNSLMEEAREQDCTQEMAVSSHNQRVADAEGSKLYNILTAMEEHIVWLTTEGSWPQAALNTYQEEERALRADMDIMKQEGSEETRKMAERGEERIQSAKKKLAHRLAELLAHGIGIAKRKPEQDKYNDVFAEAIIKRSKEVRAMFFGSTKKPPAEQAQAIKTHQELLEKYVGAHKRISDFYGEHTVFNDTAAVAHYILTEEKKPQRYKEKLDASLTVPALRAILPASEPQEPVRGKEQSNKTRVAGDQRSGQMNE